MKRMQRVLMVCVCGLAGAGVANAGVVVVTAAGGSAELEAALGHAQDGDIVLVQPGTYALPTSFRFVIDGKGLTLARDGEGAVVLTALEVMNVPLGATVVLRGLQIGPAPGYTSLAPLILQHNGGPVWIEDCTITGQDGLAYVNGAFGYSYYASDAIMVAQSLAVTLQRCTVTGGRGADHVEQDGVDASAIGGGDGIFANLCNLDLRDSVFTGGNGGDGEFQPFFYVSTGGMGVSLGTEVNAVIAGCTLTGGSNGSNDQPGDGTGSALFSGDVTSQIALRDSELTAGALVGDGIAWPAIKGSGVITSYPAPVRSFQVSSPLREEEVGSLDVSAQPGDLVSVLVALGAGWKSMPAKQGVLVESNDSLLFRIVLGTTDASGQLSVPFVAPQLIPGVQGLTIPLQLVIVGGGTTLEAASALVWIDAGL